MVLTFRSSLCDLLGNFVSLVSYANRAHKGDKSVTKKLIVTHKKIVTQKTWTFSLMGKYTENSKISIVTLFISPLNELHALSFYKPLDTCIG